MITFFCSGGLAAAPGVGLLSAFGLTVRGSFSRPLSNRRSNLIKGDGGRPTGT